MNPPIDETDEQKDTEISDYAYERTLMMEQRSEIIKRLNIQRKQSILLEQEVDGRLIRFRIRKPSIYELDGESATVGPLGAGGVQLVGTPASPPASSTGSADHFPMVELQSPHTKAKEHLASLNESQPADSEERQQQHLNLANLRPDETNVRRMHTALSLNEAIVRRSKQAKLVIINLPGAPQDDTPEAENNCKLRCLQNSPPPRFAPLWATSPQFHPLTTRPSQHHNNVRATKDMEFIEIITDKLERVLLVQNGGREVITIHS